MKGALRQLALICALVIAAMAVVGGGSAKPRTPDSVKADFRAFPGPGRVSYGEQIAYKATLENKSGSTLTKVTFRQTYPAADGIGEATLIDHTCPTTPQDVTLTDGTKQWVCDFGQQVANANLALTVVWQVPPPPEAPTTCLGCLESTGGWTVKEGANDTTDPNDSFGNATVKATLLASGETGDELLEAGGYETSSASCDDTDAPGNLRTNPKIDEDANPVSTTVCVPVQIPLDNQVDLGYAVTITETQNNARHADVCIAKLGTNCEPGYVDAEFAAPYVTHVFQVADGALPRRYSITEVSHNGNPPLAEGECSAPGECVVSIDLDNRTKIWTIVVTSPTNGYWDW